MAIELKPLAMKEAKSFWRNKVVLKPGQFNQLADAAKVHAFAIGGIAKTDELATIFSALQKAIDSGTSYQVFQDDCAAIFEKRGWTGKKAWRIDNLFRTNIQTAYQVGRYKQMARVAKLRPYWMYDAVEDKKTRPIHRGLDGKVYPADHPFWDTWYPLNGYRCRCSVTSLSKRQVEKRGLKVETEIPTMIEPIDPTTGNKLPPMQLLAEPGFGHNPGKSVWGNLVDSVDDGHTYKAELSGSSAQTKLMPLRYKPLDNLKTAKDYRRRALRNVPPGRIPDLDGSKMLAGGLTDAEYLKQFTRIYGQEIVIKDILGEPVILSLRSFLIDKTPGAKEVWKFHKSGHGEIIPLIREALEDPYEVWLTPQKNANGRVRLTKRYVSLWKTEDKKRVGGLLVFEVVRGVFKGVTAFTPLDKQGVSDLRYMEKQRQGFLLYGR